MALGQGYSGCLGGFRAVLVCVCVTMATGQGRREQDGQERAGQGRRKQGGQERAGQKEGSFEGLRWSHKGNSPAAQGPSVSSFSRA